MFGSPTEWCGVCREWVAIDATRAECACEHGCTARQCPMARHMRKEPLPQPGPVVIARPAPRVSS